MKSIITVFSILTCLLTASIVNAEAPIRSIAGTVTKIRW